VRGRVSTIVEFDEELPATVARTVRYVVVLLASPVTFSEVADDDAVPARVVTLVRLVPR